MFPTTPIPSIETWEMELNAALGGDGIRVLSATYSKNGSLLLLLSTQPNVKPTTITQRVKGRLQHILRPQSISTWQRNFRLTTVGDPNIETVERYVATQVDHHKMGSTGAQERLKAYEWQDDSFEITKPVFSSHDQYILGLHLVLVHAERWPCTNSDFLNRTRSGIFATVKKYGCRLSRLSILADHLHATLQFHYELSPEELAISFMNNVAYSHGMLRLWSD